MNLETLPYPKYIGIKHIKEFELQENLFVEQWIVPTGTKVKLINGKDFGYVILPKDTQDARNFIIPRRIFKY